MPLSLPKHLSAALVASLLACGLGNVRAQSDPVARAQAERQAALAVSEEGTTGTETEKADPSQDRTPLGVDIAALRLIAHQDQVDTVAAPGETRIEIDPAIAAPQGLPQSLEKYLDQPLSMALLAEIAQHLIQLWRDTDHPLVDVYFPEQNITQGRLQIVVREAVLGEVRTEGVRHASPEYLKKQIRIAAGERISRKVVEADLDWLNENPARRVDLIYARGEADGTSDIILKTDEQKPVNFYTGFANTGLDLTGENEWSTGVNLTNLLHTEQSLGYHFSADERFERLRSHAVFYQLPLPWRHTFSLIGAYVSSEAPGDPTTSLLPLDLMGESIQATANYRIPLPRRGLPVRHYFTLGADYKSTNTDLVFGGESVFDSSAAVVQYRAEYEAILTDKLGQTRLTLAGIYAPGDVLLYNDDASFAALREGASADYWYGTAAVERTIQLPSRFLLQLRATGQYTDSRLISTEQVLAGGYLTVRGFDENLVRGDYGVICNADLIFPSLGVLHPCFPRMDDKFNLLLFYDGAWLGNVDAPETEPGPSLQSVGVGFTWRFGEKAQARATYGWNAGTHGLAEPEAISDGKLHFGVIVTF